MTSRRWLLFFARETQRTEPSFGCADTAGSRHRHPDTELGSRNVPGLAGETITSTGNRLVHSGFHTGRKPPEPSLSKPTCVGTGHTAEEGVRPPSRHQSKIPGGPAAWSNHASPDSYLESSRGQHTVIPPSSAPHYSQCRMMVDLYKVWLALQQLVN